MAVYRDVTLSAKGDFGGVLKQIYDVANYLCFLSITEYFTCLLVLFVL